MCARRKCGPLMSRCQSTARGVPCRSAVMIGRSGRPIWTPPPPVPSMRACAPKCSAVSTSILGRLTAGARLRSARPERRRKGPPSCLGRNRARADPAAGASHAVARRRHLPVRRGDHSRPAHPAPVRWAAGACHALTSEVIGSRRYWGRPRPLRRTRPGVRGTCCTVRNAAVTLRP